MRKHFWTVLACCVGVIIGLYFQPLISGDNIFEQVRKFDRVLNTASKNYVEEVDTQKLVEAAIKGMLNELDVHSVYISAEEMRAVNEDFQGAFEGIGVEFDMINDTITIVSPISGGPSESIGILSGDKIVTIDGENAVAIPRSDVPKKLKGPKGTQVTVEIKRVGVRELLSFTITRDRIPFHAVDASYIIDGTDIGVVSMNRFAANTYSEMMQALDELEKQGMKKLILDLRHNPGGYLNQAQLIANEFIPNGDTIVYTLGRKPEFDEVFIARGITKWEKIPIVVLINQGSASASEIVSGAIQDRDRGIVVGETSYGKGLVQRQYPLGDGSTFRLTISKYYTPSGRCIQRPYKERDKYRQLVGRLDLEEGNYIFDAFEQISKQINTVNENLEKGQDKIDLESLPIYYTKNGRAVFGGGGVTPDVIVKSDTITRLSAEIRSKHLFFEFTDNLMKSQGKEIRGKYENNYLDFLRNYQITDKMLEDFRKLCESKEIKIDEEAFATDLDFYKTSIKANIARTIWDRNRFLQIFSTMDKQLQTAATLFPEAISISEKSAKRR